MPFPHPHGPPPPGPPPPGAPAQIGSPANLGPGMPGNHPTQHMSPEYLREQNDVGLLAVSGIFLICDTLFFLLRLLARRRRSVASFGWDDIMLIPAFIINIGICVMGIGQSRYQVAIHARLLTQVHSRSKGWTRWSAYSCTDIPQSWSAGTQAHPHVAMGSQSNLVLRRRSAEAICPYSLPTNLSQPNNAHVFHRGFLHRLRQRHCMSHRNGCRLSATCSLLGSQRSWQMHQLPSPLRS